jgi:hypothetical protein
MAVAAGGLIGNGDQMMETVWPNNTTPQAVDGAGATPANLCGFSLFNAAASARYVRFLNKATSPVMGTDLAKFVIALPAGTARDFKFLRPPLFDKGLWVSITTGIADNDNTAPAANDVLVNVLYQ